MTFSQLYISAPIVILSASIIIILLVVSFYRNNKIALILTVLSFILSFFSLFTVSSVVRPGKSMMLSMDAYALFYIGLSLAASTAVALLSYSYFKKKDCNFQEFYILLILSATGASVLAASNHFVTLFLGLEILSISLYAMIAYDRVSIKGTEAGVKYLILAAASSAFLLFGMALFYFKTGSLDFAEISRGAAIAQGGVAFFYFAFSLLVVGFGFKLALAPFHLWTPDVYEGAPAPVSAYIATVSKGAMFILLLRFFTILNVKIYDRLMVIFIVLSIGSMFAGNILALKQNNVKRLLAYSSIAHIGYLLVAMIAGGTYSVQAIAFYLASYFITTLAAFGVITLISGAENDADALENYRGLAWQKPLAGAVFTASLLSLAGIPLTAGFIGKYYIAFAGIYSGFPVLVVILIINSVISLFYYLRVILVICDEPASGDSISRAIPSFSILGGIVISVLALLIIWIGVYPQTLINIISAIPQY